MKRKKKVALNLGGGASRGFAHVGAIQCLKEHNIHFDVIIGISAGAIAGSLFSFYQDTKIIKNIIANFISSEELKKSFVGKFLQNNSNSITKKFRQFYLKTNLLKDFMLKGSFTNALEFENLIKHLIPNRNFSDLKIPFYCTATCLNTGELKTFNSGNLQEPVIASSSIPLVSPPKRIGDHFYLDGGLLDKLGIQTAKNLGISKTIVIDVSNPSLSKYKASHGIDLMLRLNEIAVRNSYQQQKKEATVLVEPITTKIHWADYLEYEYLIELGYQATKKKIEEIKQKLKTKHYWRLLPINFNLK